MQKLFVVTARSGRRTARGLPMACVTLTPPVMRGWVLNEFVVVFSHQDDEAGVRKTAGDVRGRCRGAAKEFRLLNHTNALDRPAIAD